MHPSSPRPHRHRGGELHALWAPEHPRPIAPASLVPGDQLDRDGTTWVVAATDVLDDGTVVVTVRRTSCNGLPGRYRIRIRGGTPLVSTTAPPGRRHVRALGPSPGTGRVPRRG